MKDEFEIYKSRTAETDKKFSPSFCLAKWYHANIYFQTGETHSCYHPAPHAIDTLDIAEKPSALHNTKIKIEERRKMLTGERPQGCQYCWNIEDLDKNLLSDRQIRTGSLYKESRINTIATQDHTFHINPDYIELSFSNLCNFKCGYCHPKASSRFLNEIKESGPYDKVKNHRCDIDWFKIYDEDNNPYLQAWWKWWPELSKNLTILRITGGEPLIQNSTYRMIEFLKQFPNDQLELNVNSNLGMKTDIVKKFCGQIQSLLNEKSIRAFKLFSSIDSWGPQATYVRTGLDLKVFEENVKFVMENTNFPITFMITFNLFAVPNFNLLLQKILEWRSLYNHQGDNYTDFHRIRFDISYLKEPLQFDINILPKEDFMPLMQKHLQFFESQVDDSRKDKFSYVEYQRFLRTFEYMKSTFYSSEKLAEGRKDFYNFFTEFDKRRDCNLLETFPELRGFWEMCRSHA